MPCRRSRSRSRQARDADSRATSRAAAIARDDNARRAPRHDAPRRTTAQTDALRPTPSRLPAFQPSSLPAFQDDRRAPPLFFRHAPSRSASRMSPRLGAIAHDPPVARDSIRAADAGRAASPEPRSRAAPRKTGQRNAPPVAPPTCRHADMPHCRHCRHCRRSPAKPLVLTRQATQPHTHSATGVPSALHRHSIGAPSTSAQTTNAQRRTRAIATPRAARRECARDRTPASREPSSRLAAQCLQSLDHAEQRAAVLFGAVPRLDDRLAQQIVVRRRQPGRLPRLDAIETA
ncbi:Uncharacterised protein [Burkholderia pseudomallei]|nr:Uncharacterised protein [Burkholderia pseudomallei]CAJ3752098.1 Uncharacterised protein [Burkholderia pseudomallei]CAJ5101966.1 Uncharacterised protein [Burkholderia pseudomallei]CAJ5161487.1 Uncharacterised protein [Burkholderia pseudomallei]CAJ5175033.1 Uncharacterised protein [Burkholderia pseudomallei]